MTAVILAAGIASRLRPLTDNTPKCLLHVGRTRILERTIDNLLANGISSFVIVTGYLAEQIRDFVGTRYPGLDVQWLHNDVYDSTNNIYSLHLAAGAVAADDMLLLDSDILFDHRIVGALLASEHGNCLAMNSGLELGDEEIKVLLDEERRVLEISKTVDPTRSAGESIGIERFSSDFCGRLFSELETMIDVEGLDNVFYEAAFERLIKAGASVYAVDIHPLPCMELDTVEDFEAAGHRIAPLLDS